LQSLRRRIRQTPSAAGTSFAPEFTLLWTVERILQELSFNRTIVNDINFSAIRYASSVPEK
jgi:hypothetical protein